MDWPHDPDGDAGSEGRRKYGQAIIAKKLDAEDFPVSTDAFLETYGDHPVRIDHEQVVSVADIFEHVEAAEFEDFPAFHTAVGEAMREADYWPLEREHA
ncbi:MULTISPECIES: DUF5785 family protein [unclassified Halorhabdus]|uniref:DUF5785 family protein n=1 Tax=unclassified Halorhabdus TaxID=2621901 RepID=UPI0023D9E891|nr:MULTISPECIES: DUF5785 family protein [unclassified Halorhabdus]WEL17165.1 Uncharacterized protein SVXHr_0990 [Halorhabdus sp. SVX81]WEL21048.1 Uncharacterized protein HBNXHr_0979 [Halorhabdus sp. BNX81]